MFADSENAVKHIPRECFTGDQLPANPQAFIKFTPCQKQSCAGPGFVLLILNNDQNQSCGNPIWPPERATQSLIIQAFYRDGTIKHAVKSFTTYGWEDHLMSITVSVAC